MAGKHREPEESGAKQRQAEVLVGQGKPVAEAVRMRPERPNHGCTCDVAEDRTRGRQRLRMLNGADEFTRECLCIPGDLLRKHQGRAQAGAIWRG